jgi:hypothetical protein
VHVYFGAIYIVFEVVLSSLIRPNFTSLDMSISITVLFGAVSLQDNMENMNGVVLN